MRWYKITGTEALLKRASEDFQKAPKLVRDTKSQVYICIADKEQNWLFTVSNDLGLKVAASTKPNYFEAPCGQLTTSKMHHMRCKSCVALRPPSRSKGGPVKTVVSVPGIQDFSLDGMIEMLEQRAAEALELATTVDTATQALKAVRDSWEKLDELQQQLSRDRDAVRYFMDHEK